MRCRWASAPSRCDGGQILLNGQPVQLNGFGRHEDFIASGKGLNLPLLVKDYAVDALDRRQHLSHLALPIQRRGNAAGRPRRAS